MSYEPIHHVISLDERGFRLVFSIDFETVEVWLPNEMQHSVGFKNLAFWQSMIDGACKILGKESRDVVAIRNYAKLPNFGNTILEYISSGGYQYVYFCVTKTLHWPRFYNHKDSSDALGSNPLKSTIRSHFETVLKYAHAQGLTSVHAFYEPDNRAFDNLYRLLNLKIDGNT